MGVWSSIFSKKAGPGNSPSKTVAKAPAPQVRVVFMGTPEFAARILSALVSEHYQIVGVVTQPDRPVGRKQELAETAVKKVASEHGLPVFQPEKLDDEAYATLQSWQPDLFIVAAYGKILKERFLRLPGFGALNIHTSLLPRWRGASPIQNALLAGDRETGITLMVMDKGMDTGDIIIQESLPIAEDDTLPVLEEKLSQLATKLLSATLPLWIKKKIVPVAQDSSLATMCQLIERSDGRIVWTDEAEDIYNRYRALTPWPGVFTFWKQGSSLARLKLHRISRETTSGESPARPIGEVFQTDGRVGVQTGRGIIFLEELQLEGRTRLPIDEFLKGNPSFIGGILQ